MKILGLGLVTVDHVLRVNSFPVEDSKNEAMSSHMQMGGPVPIALAQLRRFQRSCHFVSSWGNDAFGDVIENRLNAEQIGISQFCRGETPTSVTQVWLNNATGVRTSVTVRPDRLKLATHLTEQLVSSFDVLHLDGWPTTAALTAAKLMKAHGGIVCLDTGSPKPGIEQLLKVADVVNAPRRFCEQYLATSHLKHAVSELAAIGPQLVTVTDGENGATMFAAGQVLQAPAIKLARTVDTNGAGDSFSGALIHGVLNRWSPDRILRFAVTCAGLKCRELGNEKALPTEQQVLEICGTNEAT